MEYVFYLDWADRSKNDLIGRRGQLLNIALDKDLRIQRTCVITRNAFQSFLLETGIEEGIYSLASGVDHTSSEDMKRIHQKIREKIMDAEFPWDLEMELTSVVKELSKASPLKKPYLILYPSFGPISENEEEDPMAWSSHPGSEPQVGLKSLKELMVAVRSIWANLFSPEAVRYRRRKGIKDDSIYPAILVQTLSDAKQTGFIMSTLGPKPSSEMGVSSIYGLLPAIYEEEPVPDIYTIDSDTLDIKSREINKQTWRYGISEDGEVIKYRVGESRQEGQKIDDDQIIKLSKLAQKLESQTSGVLRLAWTITADEILITECREMSESDMDSGGVVTLEPVETEAVKVEAASSGGDVYDTGFFGGWFGGDGEDEDLSVEESAPSVPTPVSSSPVGPTHYVEEKKLEVVNVDLGDLNLNEETLGTKIYLDVLTTQDVKKVERGYYSGAFILTERFFTKSYYGAHPNVLREKKEEKSYQDDLTHRLMGVAKVLNPLPLIVKLSDFGSDEYLELDGAKQYEVSENKFLNWRGASRYIHTFFRQAFKNEVLAVKAARDVGHKNIHIMIPFVRTPREMVTIRELIKECDVGTDMKIWMMASVPSNLAFIDEFSGLVDGILLDYYMMSLVLLGLDPSIEKPEAIGHILKDQHGLGLYRHVLDALKARANKDVNIVFYDPQGIKDPDVLDLFVPYGVKGIVTSAKEIMKVYPMMASAERRYIIEKLKSLED
jgi:phosphoenolpyruvate synthase/pyruvate phosphate dikinase